MAVLVGITRSDGSTERNTKWPVCASARNFAKIGHFASGHSTGYAKSGHFGAQPRTLWYPAQDTTAPDTL